MRQHRGGHSLGRHIGSKQSTTDLRATPAFLEHTLTWRDNGRQHLNGGHRGYAGAQTGVPAHRSYMATYANPPTGRSDGVEDLMADLGPDQSVQ